MEQKNNFDIFDELDIKEVDLSIVKKVNKLSDLLYTMMKKRIDSKLSQRDLAKLILTDRANTGRILDSLEEKGLITRFVDLKNNRLVKKMGVTEKGHEKLEEVNRSIEKHLNTVKRSFTEGDVELCAITSSSLFKTFKPFWTVFL